jgi:hypothetical protein
LAALSALAPAVQAEAPAQYAASLPGGRIYVAFGANVLVSRYGRFNALNEALTPDFATQFDVSPTVIGAGPSGKVGFVLYETSAPTLLRRVRLDFAGEYRAGSSRNSAAPYTVATAFGPSALFALLSIDGQQGLLFGSTPAEDGVARLRTDARVLAGALRLHADVRIERMTITPFVGFIAESARQRYTLDFHLAGTGVNFDYAIDERVRTRRLGGEAGADLALRLADPLVVHAGGSFAYLHQRARFDGSDCFTVSNIGGGTPCSAWATSVAFTDSRMAWRTDMWLGVTIEAAPLKFSAIGMGRYDSAVPGVANPVATQAIFLGGAARPGPVVIRYSGQWSYGGMLKATLSIP